MSLAPHTTDEARRRSPRRAGGPVERAGRRGVLGASDSTWARRGGLAVALLLACTSLAGCVSRTFETRPAGQVVDVASVEPAPRVPATCSSTVLETLDSVVQRVYREGVSSERTASAQYMVTTSPALRTAVEHGNRAAAAAAARVLLKTGHLTNVTVTRAGHTLVAVGGPALAPVKGILANASGTPIASYVASVWADSGFLTEADGLTAGLVVLRSGGHSVGGSPALRPTALAGPEGTLTRDRIRYRYTSFAAAAYPTGTVRVYLLMPLHRIASLCGRTSEATTVNALEQVAKSIYKGEISASARAQVTRVQHDQALLDAVARQRPEAARLAIDALLNEHIVRVRVYTGEKLLSDVGGPYVLGPVSAPLRLGEHTIGSLVLSIQDDEGYLRLARRLAGIDVLMYAGETEPRLVKDSLPGTGPGPALAAVPASGAFHYEGRPYRVFTLHAQAFPSGPLVIRVLVPFPYLSSQEASVGGRRGQGSPAGSPGGNVQAAQAGARASRLARSDSSS